MSDSDRSGQVHPSDRPGEAVPAGIADWIPGWYIRGGQVLGEGEAPDIREGVRFCDDVGFPISFLRSTEAVRPSRPPQRGVTIGPVDRDKVAMELAVPPGYWVLRDSKGQLALYADSDLRRGWAREDARQWTPATTREEVDVTVEAGPSPLGEGLRYDWKMRDEIGKSASVVDAERWLTAFCERQRDSHRGLRTSDVEYAEYHRGAEYAYALMVDRLKLGASAEWTTPTPGERSARHRDDKPAVFSIVEELASGEGWKGTPPAEGTRRQLIRDTIGELLEANEEQLSSTTVLDLADAVESALLQATIDDEAMRVGTEALLTGIEKVDPRLSVERVGDPRVPQGRSGGSVAKGIAEDATAEFRKAIEAVGTVLDRLRAPEAPTYAQRIDRLHNDLRRRVTMAQSRDAVDIARAHNLLDGWGILRSRDEGDSTLLLNVTERLRSLIERLRRTEEDLDTEQHRPMVALEGRVPPGTRELRIVIEDVSDPEGAPEFRFIEIEDQNGASVGFPRRRHLNDLEAVNLREIVIPYGRDDEWVQRLAMAAIIAGQDVDRPFPADALDELLRSFGVLPTLPRTWPGRPHREEEPFTTEKVEIPEAYRKAIVEGAWDQLDDGDDGDDADDELNDLERRLYGQREEARAGEDRFKEERDAGYALLRWLLPVVVARPLDELERGEGD